MLWLIIKRDLRLRCGLLGITAGISLLTFLLLPLFPAFMLSKLSLIVLAQLALLVLSVIPVTVQVDTPSSSDSFHLSRPIDRRTLFIAKVTPLTTIGVLFPILSYLWLLLLLGIPFGYLIAILLYNLGILAAVVLCSIVLAALTSSKKDYYLALFIVTGLLGTFWHIYSVVHEWPPVSFFVTPVYHYAIAYEWLNGFYLWIFLTLSVACSFLSIRQIYLKSSSSSHSKFIAGYCVITLALMFAAGVSHKSNPTGITWPPAELARVATEITESYGIPYRPSKIASNPQWVDTSRQYYHMVLKAKQFDAQTFPHFLRLAQVAVTDDDNNTFLFSAGKGTIPCIELPVLEQFLSQQLDKAIDLTRQFECALGELLSLPLEANFKSGRIRKITGTVYGLTYALNLDYRLAPVATRSDLSGSGWVARMPELSRPRSRYLPIESPLSDLFEITVATPPAMLMPQAWRSKDAHFRSWRSASPLNLHWRASNPAYIVLNPATGAAEVIDGNYISAEPMRKGIIPGLHIQPLQITQFVLTPELQDSIAQGKAELLRVSPRIQETFISEISLTDVPIGSEESLQVFSAHDLIRLR